MASERIDIVPIPMLRERLSLRRPMHTPFENISKNLIEFKMEREDAPILRYLYRELSPKRHLEFGTWEGFGVVTCASQCDAEIWTINAPEGETDRDGKRLYARHFAPDELVPEGAIALEENEAGVLYQTDGGTFVGWMYRKAGYTNRVHQIFADSREWSPEFSPEFFDSVLIDGGHTADVVRNDTDKALPLIRSGGVCLWHDFCPDPEALRHLPASRGVVTAIVDNFSRWRAQLRDLFWIYPSFLLLGVKA